MSRQINPYIFGEGGSLPPVESAGSFAPLPPLFEDGPQQGVSLEELLQKIEKIHYEVQEWMKSLNLKGERTQTRMQSIEGRFNQIIQELNERQSFIMSRVRERQMSDMKVEALIERHNQIV